MLVQPEERSSWFHSFRAGAIVSSGECSLIRPFWIFALITRSNASCDRFVAFSSVFKCVLSVKSSCRPFSAYRNRLTGASFRWPYVLPGWMPKRWQFCSSCALPSCIQLFTTFRFRFVYLLRCRFYNRSYYEHCSCPFKFSFDYSLFLCRLTHQHPKTSSEP